jgi:hypothetical protein
MMTTVTGERINTGDVLEFNLEGKDMSVLVLLVSENALVLDACDGSTPFVLKPEELGDVRIFSGVDG